MREIDDALQNAQRSGDDRALIYARMTLGVALVTDKRPLSVSADTSDWKVDAAGWGYRMMSDADDSFVIETQKV